VIVYAIACIPIGRMCFQEKRTVAVLPVVTFEDAEHAGECRRVAGTFASDAVYWAPRGTGRGGRECEPTAKISSWVHSEFTLGNTGGRFRDWPT
jgi:hypothetical protein